MDWHWKVRKEMVHVCLEQQKKEKKGKRQTYDIAPWRFIARLCTLSDVIQTSQTTMRRMLLSNFVAVGW